ncbi:MAG: ABC transporter permease [Dorea formicigenerans]|nr:ABC transporter permease [Dorea formicigenerans]
MKNPLNKRLPREFRKDFGKYLVIFLLLVITIGFVSGFLVADGSMIKAYNEGIDKYNTENGHFRTSEKMNDAQIQSIEENGIRIYDNFYLEQDLTNDSTMRIFESRDQVNLACLMEGEFPKAANEIAIDRMYADNNKISIGDTLKSGTQSWKVTGFIALPDYSCLFQNNNDSMFDSVKFGIGVVTSEAFESLDSPLVKYCYAWKYNDEPTTEKEEKEVSDDLMKAINKEVSLEEFVPRYLNQAITFTRDDMGSDRAMMIVFLYIVIAIMAFVFGITISNTIAKESNVIGTLLASGYTRNELIRHYMAMPILVTLIGAFIGNILGYTIMKDVCAGMYYGSYSLPTYVTVWNAEAFLLTTIIPILLMLLVNYTVLHRKLSLSPLKFLRRDLKRRQQKHTLSLSKRIPFFSRFRLRVIFQNISNYLLLFLGISFANLLLMFGLLFPAVLDHYQTVLQDNLLCNYQYILQIPINAMDEDHKLESLVNMLYFQHEVETDNPDAEKFSAYSLKTTDKEYKEEEILLYGLADNSRYLPIDFQETVSDKDVSKKEVASDATPAYISSAYADKYFLDIGDEITLKEAYEDDTYTFSIEGIYDYEGGLTVFLPQEQLNKLFDLGSDYFSGYLSDSEITDIDQKYIGSVIDLDSLSKISRQLNVSMGSMMYLLDGFSILLFMILIYLLSKIIIEKNAQSISMTKILGYSDREISSLYLLSTTIMVVIFLLLSFPIETVLMKALFRGIMISSISGWIPLYIDPVLYVKMFLLGFGTYLLVALIEYRRIRKVPMDQALKNIE